MKKIISIITLALLFVGQFTLLSNAQLDESYKAYGGLEAFKEYATLKYDHLMELKGIVNVSDNQLFDLQSRKALITSDNYKLGFDGNEAWIAPNMEALGIPPRFYALTPLYFFELTFLFADPGVNLESLGIKELNGKGYSVVKATYDPGIWDTPDDDYEA